MVSFRDTLYRIGIILIVFLARTSSVYAFDPYIEFSISPAHPHPYETITAEIVSHVVDLHSSSITWYVDGVLQKEGVGITTLATQARNSGATSVVRVVVETPSGTYEQSLSVVPGGVDIIWEAVNVYTPPFYRGKALVAPSAIIRAVAVPSIINQSGASVDPNTLTYTWSRNGFVRDVRNQSGYGKSTLSIRKDLLTSTETISVDITAPNSSLGASNSISIPETDPEIIFYADHPLLGIQYQEALHDSYTVSDSSSVSFVAEPYFFSISKDSFFPLSFNWRVGGMSVDPDWNSLGHISIGIPEESSGTTPLSLEITSSSEYILQGAQKALSLIINPGGDTSFFR